MSFFIDNECSLLKEQFINLVFFINCKKLKHSKLYAILLKNGFCKWYVTSTVI